MYHRQPPPGNFYPSGPGYGSTNTWAPSNANMSSINQAAYPYSQPSYRIPGQMMMSNALPPQMMSTPGMGAQQMAPQMGQQAPRQMVPQTAPQTSPQESKSGSWGRLPPTSERTVEPQQSKESEGLELGNLIDNKDENDDLGSLLQQLATYSTDYQAAENEEEIPFEEKRTFADFEKSRQSRFDVTTGGGSAGEYNRPVVPMTISDERLPTPQQFLQKETGQDFSHFEVTRDNLYRDLEMQYRPSLGQVKPKIETKVQPDFQPPTQSEKERISVILKNMGVNIDVSKALDAQTLAALLARQEVKGEAEQWMNYGQVKMETQPPATDYGMAGLQDQQWDAATRLFEAKVKAKPETQKEGRQIRQRKQSSSSEDTSKKRKKHSSKEKKVEHKKAEEKKVVEKKSIEDVKQIIEAKKNELTAFEAQCQELKSRRTQFKKKSELLDGELERLRKQHGELCRKMQRRKDGHNDPLLHENSRLQSEIEKNLLTIDQTMIDVNKRLADGEKKSRALKAEVEQLMKKPVKKPEPKKAKKEEPPKKKKKKEKKRSHSSDSSSSEVSIFYEYFDPGSHWCKSCNQSNASIYDFFEHLHSAKHKQKMDPRSQPWMPESVKDPSKKKTAPPDSHTKVIPIKGAEFIIPCTGFYCSLCRVFSGDPACAEFHLKGDLHRVKYQKNLKTDPLYERTHALDRAAGMTKRTQHADGDPRPAQEAYVDDIRVVVKDTQMAAKQQITPPVPVTKFLSTMRSVEADGPKLQIRLTQPVKKTPGLVTKQLPAAFQDSRIFPKKAIDTKAVQKKALERQGLKSGLDKKRSSRSSRSRSRSMSPRRRSGGADRSHRARSRSLRRRISRSRSRDRRRAPPSPIRRKRTPSPRRRSLSPMRRQPVTRAKPIRASPVRRDSPGSHSVKVTEAIRRKHCGTATPADLKLIAEFGLKNIEVFKGATTKPTIAAPPPIQMPPSDPARFLQDAQKAMEARASQLTVGGTQNTNVPIDMDIGDLRVVEEV